MGTLFVNMNHVSVTTEGTDACYNNPWCARLQVDECGWSDLPPGAAVQRPPVSGLHWPVRHRRGGAHQEWREATGSNQHTGMDEGKGSETNLKVKAEDVQR